MLNPKHQRYVDRIEKLIEEGNQLEKLPVIQGTSMVRDRKSVHSWLTKAENIIVSVFKRNSIHCKRFDGIVQFDKRQDSIGTVTRILGLLIGAKDDLENGFLVGQEFIIASEVFDSTLQQAKFLNEKGFKDPSAVLMRVVLEDALKRLARASGLDDSKKASVMNDELRQVGVYPQPQWRINQSCLDVGNSAAHGDFHEYTQQDVEARLHDVELFIATHFTS